MSTKSSVVGDLIRELINRSNTRAVRAAAAVSGSAVIIKTIAMPAGLSEEELEAQLTLEADQYIPYPLDEVALDFEELGPVPGLEVRSTSCWPFVVNKPLNRE